MQSRIGFGSAGKYFGMDDSNSCGNEFADKFADKFQRVSIKAFGYIFIQ